MNRFITMMLAIATACASTACVNLRPELYKPPTEEQLSSAGAATYSGPVNATLRQYEDFLSSQSAWHRDQGRGLRSKDATLNEVGFFAAVAGVVGAATQHFRAAKNALVAGAATSVVSDRYQLKVQAQSYDGAATAFRCMRNHMADARDTESKATVALARSGVTINLQDFYPGIGEQVRQSTLAVLDKLEVKLRSIELPTPDMARLKEALEKSPDQPRDPGGARMAAFNSIRASDVAVDMTPIARLRANLQACVAAFD